MALTRISREAKDVMKADLTEGLLVDGALAGVKGDRDHAVNVYRRLSAMHPGDTVILQNFAVSSMVLLDADSALKALDELIESANTSKDVSSLDSAAHLSAELGAFTRFEKAVSLGREIDRTFNPLPTSGHFGAHWLASIGFSEREVIDAIIDARRALRDSGMGRVAFGIWPVTGDSVDPQILSYEFQFEGNVQQAYLAEQALFDHLATNPAAVETAGWIAFSVAPAESNAAVA